ncbi:MAG TPA: hypothetical protein VGN52_20845 [Burkholderiales bacterium]|jgi:hypothetical protein
MQSAAATTEVDRYNAAFWDMGLRWSWDEHTWRGLAHLPDDRARLSAYLRECQPHLLASYGEDFLVNAIAARMAAPRASRCTGLEAFASI